MRQQSDKGQFIDHVCSNSNGGQYLDYECGSSLIEVNTWAEYVVTYKGNAVTLIKASTWTMSVVTDKSKYLSYECCNYVNAST